MWALRSEDLLESGEAVLFVYRVFWSDEGEPLLVQEITTKDRSLTYHRNLVWEREVCYEKALDNDIDCSD